MTNFQGDSLENAKEAAGKAAVTLIQPGMIVGLGTGSTAAYFISHLAVRCKLGLQIVAIATSQASYDLAKSLEIPLGDPNEITFIDVTVDGADEIDNYKQMIKGGGGALLREKIVASMSQEMIVIIDSTKRVDFLGAGPLPVEIVPFAYKATIDKLEQLGYAGNLRLMKDETPFITENHNFIFEINLSHLCENPELEDRRIKNIPGVVETGFFIDIAGRVVIGWPNGFVEILE